MHIHYLYELNIVNELTNIQLQ